MDITALAVVYMVDYNIRLLPIIQGVAQLDATYAEDISHDCHQSCVADNHSPREQQDAATVRKQNTTRWCELSHKEWEKHGALMLSKGLKAMGFDKEVFLCRDVRNLDVT